MKKIAFPVRMSNIARRLEADASKGLLKGLLRTLGTLDELADNIDDTIGTFSMHFQAGLDPEVDGQFVVLKKAQDGIQSAYRVQKEVQQILTNFPEDKTVQRAVKDADVMIKRFTRQIGQAQKVVQTLSKKAIPPALKKFSQSVVRIIRSKLEDPKALEVIPWQKKDYPSGVMYQVILRVDGRNSDGLKREITLTENTTSAEGPGVVFGSYGTPTSMSPKQAAQKMLEALKGWSGLKGETDAIANREKIAKGVSNAIDTAISRKSPWMKDDAKISSGNTRIKGSYRSDLPKEGESDVGYSTYRDMVERETDNFKKILEPLLAPYRQAIVRINYGDGEKSWITVMVELK